ncbi:MAG: hypothetical protein JXQ27_02635 [Acidobacteria bacterium]|nr:hypothetical protein [Acidobacteriota bacterium]
MSKFTRRLGQIFLWTHERGSLAYDVIVILILLFIFLTPHSCVRKTIPQTHIEQTAALTTGEMTDADN